MNERAVVFWGLLTIEALVWVFFLVQLLRLYTQIKRLTNRGIRLRAAIKQTTRELFLRSWILHVIFKEILIWKYALCGWKTLPKRRISIGQPFTYHKHSLYFGFYIILVHEQIIEGIALHFWLHSFSHLLAWISTILHVYSVVWITGDFNAIRSSPIIMTKTHVQLKLGLRKSLSFSLKDVAKIDISLSSAEIKDSADGFLFCAIPSLKLAEALDEMPQVQIQFNHSLPSITFFGVVRNVRKVFIRLDDPTGFVEGLKANV